MRTRQTLVFFSILSVLSICSTAAAQVGGIRLVADINRQTQTNSSSSNPQPGTGQQAGVANEQDRSSPTGHFVRFNERIVFTATTAKHGAELWITNGTPSGTYMVKDIWPGTKGSSIEDMIVMGGTLYFGANDGTNGPQLWKTDGTTQGTVPVTKFAKSNWNSPRSFFRLTTKLILFGFKDYPLSSREGLWVTDGTTSGTKALISAQSSPYIGMTYAPAGTGKAFVYGYGSPDALMITDGKSAGTKKLKTFINTQNVAICGLGNGKVVLGANDGGGKGRELWVSDGTANGTVFVKDLFSGSRHGTDLTYSILFGGKVYFGGVDGTSLNNRGVYVTDGTAKGTVKLHTGTPFDFEILNNKVYAFVNAGFSGLQLVETNGTTAGTKVITSTTGPHMKTTAGKLYFSENRFGSLMVTDGTAKGTTSLGPNFRGAKSAFIQALDNKGTVVFACDDGRFGRELWISDGTVNGTKLLVDLEGGKTAGSSPDHYCDVNGIIFFSANDGRGFGFYKTDGTPSGTTLLKRFQATDMTRVGNKVVFAADDLQGAGRELWISDGTVKGTVLLKDIDPNGSSAPIGLTRVGDKVYFTANGGSSIGQELYVTDGTATGTKLVADINPGSGSGAPWHIAPVGYSGQFVFQASNASESQELFISDGTAANTKLLKAHTGSASLTPLEMTRIAGGKVVFRANDTKSQSGLWVTDGTTNGTIVLDATIFPQHITAWDHPTRAAFTGYRVATGREIYQTDGTVAGTKLLIETTSGTATMSPKYLTVSGNGKLYFNANGGTIGPGVELYETDGNTVKLVADLYPNGNSNPRGTSQRVAGGRFVDSIGRMFFTANDGQTGLELRVLDTNPWWRAVGSPCGPSPKATRHWVSTPKIGANWTLGAVDVPSGWTAITALSLKPPTIPPDCGFQVDPRLFFLLNRSTVTGSTWQMTAPVPNDQTLIGLPLMTQTVVGTPSIFAYANGVLSMFGL